MKKFYCGEKKKAGVEISFRFGLGLVFFGYVMLLRWFESLQGFSTSFKNVLTP